MSTFSLISDSKCVYIWIESGTQNLLSNIIERDRFGSAGMMVWEEYCTSLHVFNNGSLADQIFPEEVLEPYLRLFRGGYRSDFLFMDDNARPQRTNLVDE